MQVDAFGQYVRSNQQPDILFRGFMTGIKIPQNTFPRVIAAQKLTRAIPIAAAPLTVKDKRCAGKKRFQAFAQIQGCFP